MDLRIRPKSNYLAEADWQELYQLTEYWKRDVRFYEDELNFLLRLTDRYFLFFVDDEKIWRMQIMVKKLNEAIKKQENLARKIRVHLAYLAGLAENPFAHDAYAFREEHIRLEDELANFTLYVREAKREVFALTEEVMQAEKFRHLLGT